MSRNKTYSYYRKLKKPPFAPPSWLFGIIWSILYPIITISFVYTLYLIYTHQLPSVIAIPLVLNVLTNIIFTPIQFKLKSNELAALDITWVILSLIWFIYLIYPYNHVIAFAQIPYLLWGLFATFLQYSVTYLNRKN